MIESGRFLQQRYRIDKQIGQGGMGAVYIATDERFGSRVAIKETLCMDDNFRKAIEREARLLNSLKHAALPRVSDHFEEDNGQFLVMEYIAGDDVASMIENENVTFSVDQVLKWADQLLDALDYLHNQVVPVIHRDIKPQNLKINARGEMILLDFGLAKGNPTDAGHATAAKSIFGYSRNYASLEQIQGTGTDPRSDLYSLAATLYHLLTKQPPEDALTRAMSVLSQKGDTLVPANKLNPDIPRGVAGVLHKALDLNASERPASAREMREMLREPDEFAHLADEVTIATGGPTNAMLFGQPTRIMSDQTQAADEAQPTEVRTEVMPAEPISRSTTVRKAASTDPAAATVVNPRGRGFSAAAGALIMLVVVGAVAGGAYLIDPSLFGGHSENDAVNSLQPVANETTPALNSDAVAAGSESNVTTDPSAEPARPAGPDKQSENAKNTKTEKPKTEGDKGDELTVEVDNPNIPPEGIVVQETDADGKVTTVRVQPKTPQVMPPPGVRRTPPAMPDLRNMTPAQRERVLRAWRRMQEQQRIYGRPPTPAGPQPRPTPNEPQ